MAILKYDLWVMVSLIKDESTEIGTMVLCFSQAGTLFAALWLVHAYKSDFARSSFLVTGFNAAVAGCFFAIETVLRPLRAENSPPFTTAMIILASVISSTVSNALLGTQSAFTVPSYDLKSAAGMLLLTLRSIVNLAVGLVV